MMLRKRKKKTIKYCMRWDSFIDENDNFLDDIVDNCTCEYCVDRPAKHPVDCQFDDLDPFDTHLMLTNEEKEERE